MSVVVIVVIGKFLIKNKTTIAIFDGSFNELRQSKCTYNENVRHVSHFCIFLILTRLNQHFNH